MKISTNFNLLPYKFMHRPNCQELRFMVPQKIWLNFCRVTNFGHGSTEWVNVWLKCHILSVLWILFYFFPEFFSRNLKLQYHCVKYAITTINNCIELSQSTCICKLKKSRGCDLPDSSEFEVFLVDRYDARGNDSSSSGSKYHPCSCRLHPKFKSKTTMEMRGIQEKRENARRESSWIRRHSSTLVFPSPSAYNLPSSP